MSDAGTFGISDEAILALADVHQALESANGRVRHSTARFTGGSTHLDLLVFTTGYIFLISLLNLKPTLGTHCGEDAFSVVADESIRALADIDEALLGTDLDFVLFDRLETETYG